MQLKLLNDVFAMVISSPVDYEVNDEQQSEGIFRRGDISRPETNNKLSTLVSPFTLHETYNFSRRVWVSQVCNIAAVDFPFSSSIREKPDKRASIPLSVFSVSVSEILLIQEQCSYGVCGLNKSLMRSIAALFRLCLA